MVKVVGEDHSAIKRITCRHCAARLEYVPRDVQEINSKDYSGGSDGYFYIVCPRCNHEVIISSW
jgi:RNase P subunit RPR2